MQTTKMVLLFGILELKLFKEYFLFTPCPWSVGTSISVMSQNTITAPITQYM